jgi:hypothetical protein
VVQRGHGRAQHDLHALLLEERLDRLGDVPVLARHQLLVVVHQGDLRAEVREHAGELEPDVPTAPDEEPLRQRIDVLEGRRVVHARSVDALDVRQAWHRAGVDHDGPCLDHQPVLPRPDLDAARTDEVRVPLHQRDGVDLGEQLVVARAQLGRERVAAIDRAGEPVSRIGLVRAIRRVVDQSLGGDAVDVDAAAAVHVGRALHDRDVAAGTAEGTGERLSALAPSQDEDVHVHERLLSVVRRGGRGSRDLEGDVIGVAPPPVLAGLEGTHQGVVAVAVPVRGGVPVG